MRYDQATSTFNRFRLNLTNIQKFYSVLHSTFDQHVKDQEKSTVRSWIRCATRCGTSSSGSPKFKTSTKSNKFHRFDIHGTSDLPYLWYTRKTIQDWNNMISTFGGHSSNNAVSESVTSTPIITPSPLPLQMKVGVNNPNKVNKLDN